jgi:hypothetical protein
MRAAFGSPSSAAKDSWKLPPQVFAPAARCAIGADRGRRLLAEVRMAAIRRRKRSVGASREDIFPASLSLPNKIEKIVMFFQYLIYL